MKQRAVMVSNIEVLLTITALCFIKKMVRASTYTLRMLVEEENLWVYCIINLQTLGVSQRIIFG